MRTRDLVKLEAERAAERADRPPQEPRITKAKARWDAHRLRSEVEGEFRAVGAKVFRDEKGRARG